MTRFWFVLPILMLAQGCFLTHASPPELRKSIQKNCQNSSVVYTSPLGFFAYNTPSQTPQVLSATCMNSKFIIDGLFSRINLPNLEYVTGDLSILSPSLLAFSGEYLKEVSGSLIIDGRSGGAENFNSVTLERLEYLGQDLVLSHLKNLKLLHFPRLRHLGRLVIIENEGLEEIRLPDLSEISGGMFIDKNLRLKQITLSEKINIGDKNKVTDNPKLPQCALAPYKALVTRVPKKADSNTVTINESAVLKNAPENQPTKEVMSPSYFVEHGNDTQTKCPEKKKSFFSF